MSDGGALSVRERMVLEVVCETFMPPLTPGSGDDAALFQLGARDVGLADGVEQAIAGLGERQRRELRLFLRLLDRAPFMLAVAGQRAGITRLAPEQREAALRVLANSPIPPVRTGFQALKRLSTFLFYSITGDDGANPAWTSIGYQIPAPHPASSGLSLKDVPAQATLDADVCVIGSGAGGGVVAAQLTAAGRRVVVLEAGPGDQAADYDQREVIGMRRLYLDQGTTATRDLGVAMLAGSCIGGGTTVNWQTSLPLPDDIRDEWADRSGIHDFAEDAWTHAVDAVCARAGVGPAESIPNANNALLARGCAALGYEWVTIPRNARGCDLAQCGYCVFGCRVGGKQSTANTFLVDAQATGRLTLVASCRADRIRLERGRVAGVHASARRPDGATSEVRVRAPIVVAAAGALETPALLLRSGIDHPRIGRHLHLHPTTGVAARHAEPVRGWIGAPQAVLCTELARMRGSYGVRIETAPLHPGLIALAQPWFGGRDHRARMQHAAHVAAFIVLTRDQGTGRVGIGRDGRAVVSYRVGRAERALMQQGIVAAARIQEASGALEVHTLHARDYTWRRDAGADFESFCRSIARAPVTANRCAVFSAHQMGTCRMGANAATAVCDARGQVYGVPGLYVADASLFPASSGVNPMITIMALAHLVGARIGA